MTYDADVAGALLRGSSLIDGPTEGLTVGTLNDCFQEMRVDDDALTVQVATARKEFLTTVPPQKRHDPRVAKFTAMIGSGPFHPDHVHRARAAVEEAITEAEQEVFVDAGLRETTVWIRPVGAPSSPVSLTGTGTERLLEIIRIACIRRPERIVVDVVVHLGLPTFERLREDAGVGPTRRRPWTVEPLNAADQRRATTGA